MKKKSKLKKVVKHLKGDIKDFKKEASEDRSLLKELKHEKKEKQHIRSTKSNKHSKKATKRHDPKKKVGSKFEKVMHEWGENKLHAGSKKGPRVKSQAQALAIAFNEQRRAKKKRK